MFFLGHPVSSIHMKKLYCILLLYIFSFHASCTFSNFVNTVKFTSNLYIPHGKILMDYMYIFWHRRWGCTAKSGNKWNHFYFKRGKRVSRAGGKWVLGAKIRMNHKLTRVDDDDAPLNHERKETISFLKRGDRASRAAYKLPESEPLRSPSTWGRWHILRHPG